MKATSSLGDVPGGVVSPMAIAIATDRHIETHRDTDLHYH